MMKPDELCHYGVKGMKRGVRRYQLPNGKLTSEGRKRRSLARKVSANMKTTKDANEIVGSLTQKRKEISWRPEV